jgi:sarcosine oxidase subunit gamma
MAERHSALEGFAAVRLGAVALRELPFAAQVNVRTADPEPLGLPHVPNTTAPFGGSRALWLGPDEWLVVGPDGNERAIEEALLAAGGDVSVVDLSANRTILELTGPRARDVLMQGCSLDLHRRAFGPGRCAQTLLARAQVILEATGDDAFRVFVRRSFARYLAGWLQDAIAILLEEDDGAVAVEQDAVLEVPSHGT